MATETLVDLLRHGATEGGDRLRGARTDDPLTPAGDAALERAVGSGVAWSLVATSPLVRCHAFAARVAWRCGAALAVDERLREYDFGDWDGQAFATLWAEQGDALAAFFGEPDAVTPPGGENAAAFRARVRAAWDGLLERAAGGRILVVGHGGVLRQCVADTLGVTGNAHAVLEWPHAAMSRIRVYDEPPDPPCRSLVFHGRTPEAEGQ